MAESGLTLFLVLQRSQQEECEAGNVVPLEFCPNRRGNYIGLREEIDDAVDRAVRWGSVTAQTHVLLKIHFTEIGFAHFVSASLGQEHNFSTTLHKQVYYEDTTRDWKVWYFLDNLPLTLHEKNTNILLITHNWMDIPESLLRKFRLTAQR